MEQAAIGVGLRAAGDRQLCIDLRSTSNWVYAMFVMVGIQSTVLLVQVQMYSHTSLIQARGAGVSRR